MEDIKEEILVGMWAINPSLHITFSKDKTLLILHDSHTVIDISITIAEIILDLSKFESMDIKQIINTIRSSNVNQDANIILHKLISTGTLIKTSNRVTPLEPESCDQPPASGIYESTPIPFDLWAPGNNLQDPAPQDLLTLIQKRHSSVTEKGVMAIDKVGSILYYALQSAKFRSYASAGGIYAVNAYLITIDEAACAQNFLYYDRAINKFRRFSKPQQALDALAKLNSEITKAGTLLTLTVEMEGYLKKYASRGYHFALFEIGAAAHSIQLVSSAFQVKSCARGRYNPGHFDHSIIRSIFANKKEVPLLFIELGK